MTQIIILYSGRETNRIREALANAGVIGAVIVGIPTSSQTQTEQFDLTNLVKEFRMVEAPNLEAYFPHHQNYEYPSEKNYRSKKYSIKKEPMSREHRYIAYRTSNSWQRENHLRR